MGSALCAVLAVAYAAFGWWVIFDQRWGPVVGVIDERAGMGVHSGDIVGVLAGLMAVACGLFGAVLLDEGLGLGRRVATARVAHRVSPPRPGAGIQPVPRREPGRAAPVAVAAASAATA